MLFINTRPADRAASLTHALVAQKISVLDLPLLELMACPLDGQLTAQFQRLSTMDVVVVVSPMAVSVGMSYLQQLGYSTQQYTQLNWVAVGQTTAEHLQQYGVSSIVPEIETSEGMLELALLRSSTSPCRIAFWRGEGGRQFMMQTLYEQGHHVENMLLYQRRCPLGVKQHLLQHLNFIQQHQQRIVLISSEASWLNWLALIDAVFDVSEFEYWVLGERLAQVLQHYATQHQINMTIKMLWTLKTDEILHVVQQHQGLL